MLSSKNLCVKSEATGQDDNRIIRPWPRRWPEPRLGIFYAVSLSELNLICLFHYK